MTYQIDQSGKIEQTNKDTALCLSNSKWEVVMIKAKSKRQIQEIFRRNGQIRNYVLFTFCAGVSLLIKRSKKFGKITIDREYFGKEPIIKKILLEMLKTQKRVSEITFATVGRRVMAHRIAYLAFKGKLKRKLILEIKQILNEIKMTEVGKRLKDA